MTLVAYENYWGGKPHLDQFILRKIDDLSALGAQLETGEIDIYGGHNDVIDPATVAALEGGSVNIVESGAIYGLTINLNVETPFFEDVRVRQALVYALDRPAIVEGVLFGYGEVSDLLLNIDGAYDQAAVPEPYPYDAERAGQLLEEAGWVMGADGIREKNGVKFEINGWYEAGDSTFASLAAVMQEYWRAVGIDMLPSTEDGEVLYERMSSHEYDMGFYPFTARSSIYIPGGFTCDAPDASNWAGYCNPEFDALATEYMVEFDADRRLALITEILAILAEDAVTPVVCYQKNLGAVSKRVHNFYPSYANWFFNAETWWVDA
jgi:peptide/nickel transport system substrate-binding protein